jgi:hypothetical protein
MFNEHHLATVPKSIIKHLVNDTNIIWQQLLSTIKHLENDTNIIWQQFSSDDGRVIF